MGSTFAWWWTQHAMFRCAEMRLQPRHVEEVLEEPAMDYPARHGCRIRSGCGLAIVFDASERAIVTILWDGREGRWSDSAESEVA